MPSRLSLIAVAAAGSFALAAGSAVAGPQDVTKVYPKDPGDTEVCKGDYSNFSVKTSIYQGYSRGSKYSYVGLDVRGAAPKTSYTVWVRTTEPNPLTDRPVTPLVPTRYMKYLARVTPDDALSKRVFRSGTGDAGRGRDLRGTNGFVTNRRGSARFRIKVDYWVYQGELPFGRVQRGLPTLPIQYAKTEDPRTLTVVSHCGGRAHGLVPSTPPITENHQNWFDVSYNHAHQYRSRSSRSRVVRSRYRNDSRDSTHTRSRR